MSDRRITRHELVRPGPVRISLVALRCLLRGLPRLFRASPKTPLRVLGIIALDTLRVLRTSQPLPRKKIGELARVLDFLGCTNAAWDRKDLCRSEFEATRRRLEQDGLGVDIDAFLSRLRELESRRPGIGGDARRFDEVRSYREAVARLCVGTAAAIALDAGCAEEAIRTTQHDADVETLIRILLQCQVIDDVVDYAEDVSAGLPSFLTATASLPEALDLTSAAAHTYGSNRDRDRSIFPFRITLALFTATAGLVVRVAARRHRQHANLEEVCRRVET